MFDCYRAIEKKTYVAYSIKVCVCFNVDASLVSHLRDEGQCIETLKEHINVQSQRESIGHHVNVVNLHAELCFQLQPLM